MLVIIHAKFEVNSYCGLDFRQGVNLPPPHAQTLRAHSQGAFTRSLLANGLLARGT